MVSYAKVSPKMVNPRDKAGEQEEEDDITLVILTFIQDHCCMRNQKLWFPSSLKFCWPFG